MTLAPGGRIGPYEIEGLLGAGGMGEVWRARDPRLDRDVAVKVLPGDFLEGEERKARFEREARLLAALSHPGIAGIYSFEEIAGRNVLCMEYVEGRDLAQLLSSGPLPLEESLSYARQIAEALEAAHEKGIVHRDLKPANVKVTPDGRVKLLDFGLAKAIEGDAGSGSAPSVTHSPTLTARATAAGVILGTAAYMSPEQARGKPVDKRTDVWAFGCVLYEMLTGKRAFEGETVTDVLAAVLTREPDWAALPAQVPGGVRRVLRKCLQRDAKLRLRDIGDARLDLEEETGAATRSRVSRGSKKTFSVLLPWALAAACAAAAGVLALRARAPQAPTGTFTSELVPPDGWNLDHLNGSPVLSPDGTRLAFVASDGKKSLLCVRSLATGETRFLAGTETGRNPFWSPDGRMLGFMGQTTGLAIVPAAGGPVEFVANSGPGRGGDWSAAGDILYSPALLSSIYRIAPGQKQRVAITTLDASRGESAHQWPHLLPDGKHFLYVVQRVDAASRRSESELCVQALGEKERKVLLKAASHAIYVRGHLLYVWNEALVAQPFDLARLETSGEPFVVVPHVQYLADGGTGIFSASANLLVYASGGTIGNSQLVVLDRAGRIVRNVTETGNFWTPRVSPDGRLAAAEVIDPMSSNRDVWTFDVVGADPPVRRTFDAGEDYTPVFSPDSRRIAWGAFRKGTWAIYEKSLVGGDDERVIGRSAPAGTESSSATAGAFLASGSKFLTDWSPDGRLVAFNGSTPESQDDMWVLSVADGFSREILKTPTSERDTAFSPDGKWIAYLSSETSRQEVYVRPFGTAGGKSQVSIAGGYAPRWRRDGRELFYIAPGGRLMAVPVKSGTTFEKGAPTELFTLAIRRTNIPQYDPFPDGTRFLANAVVTEKAATPLTVVQGWSARKDAR